ncbi:TPA: LysR family transcriptional regulator, partial [Klebsiella pneumoniae]|nr:LysR family transcriptional regulator [Klebsiella pneumoniae]
MQLGYATVANTQHSMVVNAFAERCRMFISDQYIPGMAAPSYFDPQVVRVA